jgi:hypothetical protein
MSSVPRIMSVCAFGTVLLTFQGDLLPITGRSELRFSLKTRGVQCLTAPSVKWLESVGVGRCVTLTLPTVSA